METPRRPPRFRFSLGAMLLLVTVLCGNLGWQTNIVRQRRAAMSEAKASSAFSFTTADEWEATYAAAAPGVGLPLPEPLASIPTVRRWLGDDAIQQVYYYRFMQEFEESQLTRLQQHFPEAKFLESLPEPCHPGCFPHGTLVETPHDPRPIETIAVGDELIVIPAQGEPKIARVSSIFLTSNRLWRIQTPAADLLTTEIQPLCLSDGRLRPAGKIQPGDLLRVFDNSKVEEVAVLSAEPTERIEPVVNLVLQSSEVFIAGGFLARSKPPLNASSESSALEHPHH